MDLLDLLGEDIDISVADPYLSIIKKTSNLTSVQFKKMCSSDLSAPELNKSEIKILKTLDRTDISRSTLIMASIRNGTSMDQLIRYITWKEFETITAEILSLAGWESKVNFRYFGEGGQNNERHRFEVDVVAWKKPYVLLIDNKRHAKTSKSYLHDAVIKQQSRTYELYEMLPIIHEIPEVSWMKKWKNAYITPVILTWKDHGIKLIESSPIVSSINFLDVLSNLESYAEEQDWFRLKWERI